MRSLLRPLSRFICCALCLGSSLRADDTSSSGSTESQSVGQAAETSRKAAANSRLRNTALAIGVIAVGIIALIAVGNNGNRDEGCCSHDACDTCDG
ncbi:MAG: hypothetical protein ACOYKZ_06830 [Chlamydiia bacterium]